MTSSGTFGGTEGGPVPRVRPGSTAGMPFGTGAQRAPADDPGAARRQPGPPADPRDDPAAARAYAALGRPGTATLERAPGPPQPVSLATSYLGARAGGWGKA